jgi:hypothetical protein
VTGRRVIPEFKNLDIAGWPPLQADYERRTG